MNVRRFMACGILAAGVAVSAPAAEIDLTITASWSAADYDVSSTGPTVGALGIPQEDDDQVFGVAPSAGSTTFTLRVNTSPVVSFATGQFGVTHDWFGYSNVQLIGTHTFGTASWTSADIGTALVGPNGSTAALWTDTDLSVATPTLVSFRMQGEWAGPNSAADLFLGSRTATTIGSDFLLAEFFGGEEIRNDDLAYAVTSTVLPEPATAVLLLGGLLGAASARRRRALRQLL